MQEYQELTQNLGKIIKSLKRKSGRDEHELFLAEGIKICSELINSDYEALFCVIPGNADDISLELADRYLAENISVYKVQRKLFDQLCDVNTPQDFLAVVKQKEYTADPQKSFLALDAISDPGNVGTIIRTADWFGFKQIILGRGCADIFNPKTVRSSMGSLFRMKLIRTDSLSDLIKNKFRDTSIYGAFADAKNDIREINLPERFGIILGNESRGVSKEISRVITERIKISGSGETESLNVSVAGGIILYEIFNSLKINQTKIVEISK